MSTKIKYKGETVTSIEGGQTATLHLTGKKLTDDLVIEASGGSNLPTYNGEYISLGIKLISFTIDGATYQAVEGMSWKDWVADAKYNTIEGLAIYADTLYNGDEYLVAEGGGFEGIDVDNPISNGGRYYWYKGSN